MPIVLPEKFALAHDVSFGIQDLLTDYVVEGERAGLTKFEVSLKSAEHVETLASLSGDDFWQWCEDNDYREILDEHSHRNLIFGLLSDMCHFVHEGLQCSAKGKLAVAYALLRKPLQDNLFYLEWILADWPGFLENFRRGPTHLVLDALTPAQKQSRRVEIIGRAMDKTVAGRWIDPNWLYELRYEKASTSGLDPIFNQAIHLVTTTKHYRTEPENINFIFSSEEDFKALWEHIYCRLPTTLFHAFQIVRALFKSIDESFTARGGPVELWLISGLALWCAETDSELAAGAILPRFSEAVIKLNITCPRCAGTVSLETENLLRIWNLGEIRCGTCKKMSRLVEPHHVELYHFKEPVIARIKAWIARMFSIFATSHSPDHSNPAILD